jgi:predicted Zn-dependent peptidase
VSRLMQKELDDRPYDWDRCILDAVQKVTPADVERVAAKYLRPENLTICVFGALTAPDRQALAAKYPVTVLPKSVVFRGGFDEPAVDVGKGDSLR